MRAEKTLEFSKLQDFSRSENFYYLLFIALLVGNTKGREGKEIERCSIYRENGRRATAAAAVVLEHDILQLSQLGRGASFVGLTRTALRLRAEILKKRH